MEKSCNDFIVSELRYSKDIARRDKKGFFSDQCKETEENNRMGKTRDLFKKKDIKKRWQEYTEELHKKDLYNADYYDGVITHLEPDIL